MAPRAAESMRYAAFRVDASTTMGIGHVMRCLTLAEGLQQTGIESLFVCRAHRGDLCDLISARGFRVVKLPLQPVAAEIAADAPHHIDWLGADWRVDVEQMREALSNFGGKPLWLISDHYGVDYRWEQALRPAVGRIMIVDDLADRRHDCDVLLDQNLVLGMEQRYLGKTPEGCAVLLGPEYALLQPAYAQLHERAVPRAGSVRRLLIFFGGGDTANLTGRSIAAFLNLQRPDIQVDVVITAAMLHADAIREQVAGHDNIRLHSTLPTLADLIFNADLAIGAGGATSWERLCLGLPALVITLADNQRPLAEGLQQAGFIRWLGHSDMVDESALTAALGTVIREGLDEHWSRSCLAAVDGKGMQRVRATLLVDAHTPLVVRPAVAADEHQLLIWANDPVTRRNAFSTEMISAESHHRWFQQRLAAPERCRLFIVESGEGVPIGQVRFDRSQTDSPASWVISYSLAAAFRGRGCGRPMLQSALSTLAAQLPGIEVTGLVKAGNTQSRRIFEALGFTARLRDDQVLEYRRLLVS